MWCVLRTHLIGNKYYLACERNSFGNCGNHLGLSSWFYSPRAKVSCFLLEWTVGLDCTADLQGRLQGQGRGRWRQWLLSSWNWAWTLSHLKTRKLTSRGICHSVAFDNMFYAHGFSESIIWVGLLFGFQRSLSYSLFQLESVLPPGKMYEFLFSHADVYLCVRLPQLIPPWQLLVGNIVTVHCSL